MAGNQLQDKWVLITGAASGIGLETAYAMARQGARLILCDVNLAALRQAQERLVAMGSGCWIEVCDIADEAAVQAMAARIQGEVGALDVLVNNAGVFFFGGFQQTPSTAWQRVVGINLLGVVHVTQAFLPAMRDTPGRRRIVNVASLAGMLPAPNMSAYAASKHAVVGLSKGLAMELAASQDVGQVGVMVVCPGVINTPIAQGPAIGSNITERQVSTLQSYYSHVGCHPRVVAEAVVEQLWSDQAYLFVGPKARIGHLLVRLSRRLARCFSIRSARQSGYLDPFA